MLNKPVRQDNGRNTAALIFSRRAASASSSRRKCQPIVGILKQQLRRTLQCGRTISNVAQAFVLHHCLPGLLHRLIRMAHRTVDGSQSCQHLMIFPRRCSACLLLGQSSQLPFKFRKVFLQSLDSISHTRMPNFIRRAPEQHPLTRRAPRSRNRMQYQQQMPLLPHHALRASLRPQPFPETLR